jgi:hypothetical protein
MDTGRLRLSGQHKNDSKDQPGKPHSSINDEGVARVLQTFAQFLRQFINLCFCEIGVPKTRVD